MSITTCSDDNFGVRISGSSSLLDGYDKPEILLSSTRSVCLKGVDAGHVQLVDLSVLTCIPRRSGSSSRAFSACQTKPVSINTKEIAWSNS